MIYCDPDSTCCFVFSIDDMTVESADPKDVLFLPPLDPESVPLRTGPPTKEELLVHYPARFTWTQLKAFVNSGWV